MKYSIVVVTIFVFLAILTVVNTQSNSSCWDIGKPCVTGKPDIVNGKPKWCCSQFCFQRKGLSSGTCQLPGFKPRTRCWRDGEGCVAGKPDIFDGREMWCCSGYCHQEAGRTSGECRLRSTLKP